jgi:hypothetical protein
MFPILEQSYQTLFVLGLDLGPTLPPKNCFQEFKTEIDDDDDDYLGNDAKPAISRISRVQSSKKKKSIRCKML